MQRGTDKLVFIHPGLLCGAWLPGCRRVRAYSYVATARFFFRVFFLGETGLVLSSAVLQLASAVLDWGDIVHPTTASVKGETGTAVLASQTIATGQFAFKYATDVGGVALPAATTSTAGS